MPNLSIEELARFEAIEDAVERWLARPMHEDASNGELVHDLIACGIMLGDQRGPYPDPTQSVTSGESMCLKYMETHIDLTPRMELALLAAKGGAIRSHRWLGDFEGFATRTLVALEKRGLIERQWTGGAAGHYLITDKGRRMAEEIIDNEDGAS